MSSKKQHYVCQYPGCHNQCDGNCSGFSYRRAGLDCASRGRRRYSISLVFDAASDSSAYDDATDADKCEKCGR